MAKDPRASDARTRRLRINRDQEHMKTTSQCEAEQSEVRLNGRDASRRSQDIFEKIGAYFEAVHDVERGTPFRMLDAIMRDHKDESEALLIHDRAAAFIEQQEKRVLELELALQPISRGDAVAARSHESFILNTLGGTATGGWTKGDGSAATAHQDLYGWISALECQLVGSGQKTLKATLEWGGTARASGYYRLAPQKRHKIIGWHKVTGRGWKYSGYDSSVEVWFWRALCRESSTIISNRTKVSSDRTKSENRTGRFNQTLERFGEIFFKANAGERITLLEWIEIPIWANNEGSVRVCIDSFGLMTNGFDDILAEG